MPIIVDELKVIIIKAVTEIYISDMSSGIWKGEQTPVSGKMKVILKMYSEFHNNKCIFLSFLCANQRWSKLKVIRTSLEAFEDVSSRNVDDDSSPRACVGLFPWNWVIKPIHNQFLG